MSKIFWGPNIIYIHTIVGMKEGVGGVIKGRGVKRRTERSGGGNLTAGRRYFRGGSEGLCFLSVRRRRMGKFHGF